MKDKHTTVEKLNEQIEFLHQQIDVIHRHVRNLLKDNKVEDVVVFLDKGDSLLEELEELLEQREMLNNSDGVFILEEKIQVFEIGEEIMEFNLN
jgi:uncharacterized protein YoxC